MTWSKEKWLSRFFLLLMVLLALASCQEAEPTSDLPSPTPSQDRASKTPSPSPTRTSSPTSTVYPTYTPSPTSTLTPTALPPALGLTPIPKGRSVINQDNIDQLDLLAVWGNGAPNDIALSGDTSLLAVGTDLGTYLYDSFDFRLITLLRSEEEDRFLARQPVDFGS
ncbi:MAG: hypothetical protein ACOCYU_03985 [Brevefilum sp.]